MSNRSFDVSTFSNQSNVLGKVSVGICAETKDSVASTNLSYIYTPPDLHIPTFNPGYIPPNRVRLKFVHSEHTDLFEYECCLPQAADTLRTNILFISIPKCGNEIVQNVLMRFGISYSLSFMLPEENATEISLPPKPEEGDSQEQYPIHNILTHPTIFDPEFLVYMFPDTRLVTMIREPIALYEELYNEYLRTNTDQIKFTAFLKMLSENSETLENTNISFNLLSLRLGFSKASFKNDVEIQQFVYQVETQFDFVMIYEKFQVSLVLLANMMGWSLHYVSHLAPPVTASADNTYKLTQMDKLRVMELNLADMLLYAHFEKKFENCALQYGIEFLLEDVQTLSALNQQLQNCGSNVDLQYTDEYWPWDCEHVMMSQEKLTQEIRSMKEGKKQSNGSSFQDLLRSWFSN